MDVSIEFATPSQASQVKEHLIKYRDLKDDDGELVNRNHAQFELATQPRPDEPVGG